MKLPDELYYYDGTYDDGSHYKPLPDDVLRSYIEEIIRATWNESRPSTPRSYQVLIDRIIDAAEQEKP